MLVKPRFAFAVLLGLLLGACSGGEDGIPRVAGAAVAGAQAPTPSPPRFAQLANVGNVALPDPARKTYRAGAHEWLPVNFSEAHALAALGGGRLVVPVPGGAPVAVDYLRHVDHEDGNWTFVGTSPDGGDAVITFGHDAVFGSVHTASGTLRMTTDQRGGWVVRSPRGRDEAPLRGGGLDDVLIPPPSRGRLVQDPDGPSTAAAEKLAAQAGTAVVDVVVGYTQGLATARGGDSAARTRVVNLVEITNQAYVNSGLDARLRLVHAMPVAFPDATKNDDALHKLTGFQSGVGRIPVDPALQVLHAARDQYGGDLVVLVRNFQTPENDGCGIAWLLGSGGSVIDQSSAAFAFTVVADGSDLDETDGKRYFCREETFAHEVGHLVGQVHNPEDASRQGAHPYSYGYRQTELSGFYTVMAYRIKDSSQHAIRHFANPAVLFQGAPTGVENSADNVRSMRQTIPVVASFRATVVAAPAPVRVIPMDVNVDGKSDIFLRGGNAFAYWGMNGPTRILDAYLGTASAPFRFVAFGNFDGVGGTDVLWADGSRIRIWFNDGTGRYVVYEIGAYATGLEPFAASDVNGDGKSDILFRAPDGTISYWIMDSTLIARTAVAGNAGTGYRLIGSGDFNNDGLQDLAWANGSDLRLWLNTPSSGYVTKPLGAYSGGWTPVGVGDVNGDGSADIVFEGGTALAYWIVSQGSLVSSHYAGDGGTGFKVFAIADYNGDGLADIGWQNGFSIKVWMNAGNGQYSPSVVGNYVCCWKPEGGLLDR